MLTIVDKGSSRRSFVQEHPRRRVVEFVLAREWWRAEGEMCAAILNHASSPIRPPHHVVQKEKSSKEKEKKLTVQPIRIAQVDILRRSKYAVERKKDTYLNKITV
jgi:hypothetical protein